MSEIDDNEQPVHAEDAQPVSELVAVDAVTVAEEPQPPAEDAPLPADGEASESDTAELDADAEAEPIEPQAVPAQETPSEPATPSAPDAALVEGVTGGLTWIPYAVYLGLWIVLSGLSAYLLYGATPEQPARWMPEYVPLLWTGVGLTAFGPVLSLAVWLVARTRRPVGARQGLFSSAFTRGALVAFFGVVLWLGTLFVLELLASGWTL